MSRFYCTYLLMASKNIDFDHVRFVTMHRKFSTRERDYDV